MNIPEDRKITKLPKYYNNLCTTPYRNNDFSQIVYQKCNKGLYECTLFKICKIIVIGDVCVGKTCLVNR